MASMTEFILRPLRLAVRTPPFHGGNTGSIPVGVAIHDTRGFHEFCERWTQGIL